MTEHEAADTMPTDARYGVRPTGEITNAIRAARGAHHLRVYEDIHDHGEPLDAVAADLIADIFHALHEAGVSDDYIENVIPTRAHFNYVEERAEEETDYDTLVPIRRQS